MRWPIRVYIEDYADSSVPGGGVFTLWSQHKSGKAAEKAFKECLRDWPSQRCFVMDASTGERRQYNGHGHMRGPFMAKVAIRWVE